MLQHIGHVLLHLYDIFADNTVDDSNISSEQEGTSKKEKDKKVGGNKDSIDLIQ